MSKTYEELLDLLPESSTQLVSLNTRIPRYLNDRLDLSVGILQTEHRYHKITKQIAVQILLEKGYEAILAEFEGMDNAQASPEPQSVRVEPEKKPHRTYDMAQYAQIANKTIIEPQQQRANNNNVSPDSRVYRLQQKLGLR
jgi:hypothetical protein